MRKESNKMSKWENKRHKMKTHTKPEQTKRVWQRNESINAVAASANCNNSTFGPQSTCLDSLSFILKP